MMLVDTGEIHYTDTYTDDDGQQWHSINGHVHYPADRYTMDESIADYKRPESCEERMRSEYSAWCD